MRYAKSIQEEKSNKFAAQRRVILRRAVGCGVEVGEMNFEVPVSVRLDKDLYASIKKYAKGNSLGVGAAIRMLLNKGLKKSKDEESSSGTVN